MNYSELSPKNGIKFGGRISQSSWRQEVIQRLEDEALQQIHRANLHITKFFAEKLLYLRSWCDFTYLEHEQCTTGKENRNEANLEILRVKPIIYDLQHLLMFAPLAEPSTGACEAGAPRRVRAKLRRHSRCKWLSAGLLLSAKLNSREEMGQHTNLTTPDWIDMERH